MPVVARMPIRFLLLLLACVICTASARAAAHEADSRVVYFARDLSDEELIVLGATLAGNGENNILLLDSPKATPYLKSFLALCKPARIISVGGKREDSKSLEEQLSIKLSSHWPPSKELALDFTKSFFSQADDVVVCPSIPRGALLQAACLAGELRAPLLVWHGNASETTRLVRQLGKWNTRRVHLVGKASKLARHIAGAECVLLSSEQAVASAYQKQLTRLGRIENLVFTNPADTSDELGGMSALAPWLAVQRRAALLLTNAEGNNVAEVMERAQRHEALRRIDALVFVANLKAIPVWRRPNPIPGDKDQQIEMEPLTPTGEHPFTYAVGRLFHEDRAVVTLMLARQRLLMEIHRPLKALVASNSGSSLSLLETFSRNTIEELRNAGLQTTTLLGSDVSRAEIRKQLSMHDLFLWEGHSGTLMNDYEFPTWTEPLPPCFVFLQSCLSLTEARVGSLLNRGAVAVLGSSTRTYSGSGGACSLAFFNALLYDESPVGDSLRQAKNFLLAYSLLKEKRLGKAATRKGANIRSAWAFTLWGDPTLKLPLSPRCTSEMNRPTFIRHEVHGNTITVSLPEKAQEVKTDKFQVQVLPNGRFAGLVRKQKIDERRPLVPFVFAEVQLPKARPGWTPRLTSNVPSKRWVFCWDDRRRCGYLLVTPRNEDTEQLRFHVHWESVQVRVAD